MMSRKWEKSRLHRLRIWLKINIMHSPSYCAMYGCVTFRQAWTGRFNDMRDVPLFDAVFKGVNDS